MGLYNVYPMGTTIYDPEKAWSGYTLMQCQGIGAVLVDMNGNVRDSRTNCFRVAI